MNEYEKTYSDMRKKQDAAESKIILISMTVILVILFGGALLGWW